LGQAVEQGINAGTGRCQARFERIALLREVVDLSGQQGIGTLQFLIPQQEAFYTLCNLLNLNRVRHGRIVRLIAENQLEMRIKSTLLVLAVWFTCRSSTGSRKVSSDIFACAAPATVKRTKPVFQTVFNSQTQPLGVLNTRLGRFWEQFRQPGYRPTT
jgi:hypothetical protein